VIRLSICNKPEIQSNLRACPKTLEEEDGLRISMGLAATPLKCDVEFWNNHSRKVVVKIEVFA